MKTTKKTLARIHKVRRRALGGKRAMGWDLQARGRRIRRPDPHRVRLGKPDGTLTGVAGLAAYGVFLRRLGLDRILDSFNDIKPGSRVVYPMGAQLRLLLDAAAVGELRVFGIESLGSDPLFVHLAGGSVPSVDTLYRDLCRVHGLDLAKLELVMADQGLAEVRALRGDRVHLDVDTTVEPLFGHQEGALPGPNPRYHGRPSYHPLLGVVAETGTCVGAVLRPGDRGFGGADAGSLRTYVDRVRSAVGPTSDVVVRIDAGGDCSEFFDEISAAGAHFLVKARLTADLLGAVAHHAGWTTVDSDAEGRPLRQVAEIHFSRGKWRDRGLRVRVVAVRSLERDIGKQVFLWPDLEYTTHVVLTNDFGRAADDVARDYDGRAEVETIIAELKGALGIGKVPSQVFDANHTAFLLKLLAHNLLRRYARHVEAPRTWRLPWIRRALFLVPGRLVRSGHQWTLRLPPRSPLLLAAARLE
jgi:Transposase DDE domain group 1